MFWTARSVPFVERRKSKSPEPIKVLFVNSITRASVPSMAGPGDESEPRAVPLPKTFTSVHCCQFVPTTA